MSGETRAAANGRWRAILPLLGINPRFLTNRHGPCPLCGGRDRYRFDDKDGDGTYYCNACGAGNGITLLRKLHKWDFRTACEHVDRVLGANGQCPKSSKPETTRETRLEKLGSLLDGATDPSIVRDYLNNRGLCIVPTVLRGHPALSYYDNGRFCGYKPAMLAPVIGPDGALQSLHRTYLADVPSRKKLSPPVDTVIGAAVRLFEPTEMLDVCEGIETAIAVHELFGRPAWAVLSAGNMEAWRPPDGVTQLRVFADNDKNFAGQKAAYILANALATDRKRSVSVSVHVPPTPGHDWLDYLLSERGG